MNKIKYLTLQKKIRDCIPEAERLNFDVRFSAQEKKPNVALVLSLLIGELGIDRFYIGNIGSGITKLFITFISIFYPITLALILIDWFLIMSATRYTNLQTARNIANINGAKVPNIKEIMYS